MVLAAAAIAAAGAYFLYGKNGAQNRRKVRAWALKVRGEVLEQMERMKDMNEDIYRGIIGAVTRRYGALKNVDPAELGDLARELASYWRSISAQMKEGARKSSSPQRKAGRRSLRRSNLKKDVEH